MQNEPFENLDPAQTKERLDQGWTFVDVRTPPEFAEGHPPGSYNVPIAFPGRMGMELNERFVEVMQRLFQPDEKLVLLCKSGPRSMHACRFLAEAGYQHLVNLDGGMHGTQMFGGGDPGWIAEGLPVAAQPEAGRTWDELEEE